MLTFIESASEQADSFRIWIRRLSKALSDQQDESFGPVVLVKII